MATFQNSLYVTVDTIVCLSRAKSQNIIKRPIPKTSHISRYLIFYYYYHRQLRHCNDNFNRQLVAQSKYSSSFTLSSKRNAINEGVINTQIHRQLLQIYQDFLWISIGKMFDEYLNLFSTPRAVFFFPFPSFCDVQKHVVNITKVSW